MSALTPVQRSRAVLGAGVRAAARAYRDTAAGGQAASPRFAPFAAALSERPRSSWEDPFGPVTSELFARLTDADVAELQERLEPELRTQWGLAHEPMRRRMALAYSLWYGLPGVIERTGLSAAMPPESTHAMARGPL
ncbi:MAG TPA: hypothetical protein VFZ89_06610, partial [Solirubrobacteraceae bacterium]